MNSAVHRPADSELSRDPIDAITAFDLAISYAYKAGFAKAFVSMKTESCYLLCAASNGCQTDGVRHKGIWCGMKTRKTTR